MKTLFISDLHLCEEEPRITQDFLKLLSDEALEADALYILGDLFERWIGDDENTELQHQVADAIKAFSQSTPVYFMQGNRDFLLGKRYAKRANMTIIPDPTVINLYGKNILLMHGDSLCTLDTAYQAYRKKAHNALYQKLFLALPLFIRKKIANKLREKSKGAGSIKPNSIMDVSPDAVESTMNLHQVDLLIHGHTHLPDIHQNTEKTRIVLGAWHDHGNVLSYDDQGHFEMKNF